MFHVPEIALNPSLFVILFEESNKFWKKMSEQLKESAFEKILLCNKKIQKSKIQLEKG